MTITKVRGTKPIWFKSYQEVADILTATGEKDAIVDITPSSWDDLMCASAL
jgi:hypothetical protein